MQQPSFQKEFDEIRNTFKDTVVSMLRDDAPAVVKKAILSVCYCVLLSIFAVLTA
jgi:hypothetical protein